MNHQQIADQCLPHQDPEISLCCLNETRKVLHGSILNGRGSSAVELLQALADISVTSRRLHERMFCKYDLPRSEAKKLQGFQREAWR